MPRPRLAVIIPAYNESERILPTLERMASYFSCVDYSWSVVVVNDGSLDDTAGKVQMFASGNPAFSLIDSQPNRGKGFVVRKGMMEVDADYLLLSDADLATPIEELEKLWVKAHEGFPVAIGSRPLKESSLEIRQPWVREMGGRTFNKFVQLLAVPGIKDTQCGFKLFESDAAHDIFRRCKLNGFGFDFEALMVAHDLGYKIAEVGVRWKHIEGSKFSPFREAPKMLAELFRLRLAGKRGRLSAAPELSRAE